MSLSDSGHLRERLACPGDEQSGALYRQAADDLDRRVTRDLTRYRSLLTTALRSVDLSLDEVTLLVQLQIGAGTSHLGSARDIVALVSDVACASENDSCFQDAYRALQTKLMAMSWVQLAAILDALERLWTGDLGEESFAAEARAVGLLRARRVNED